MPRSLLLAVVVGLLAAGCGDDNPTAPTPQNTYTFNATLLPANEVPPITNAESTGSGRATLTMHVTRDASNQITAATVDVSSTYTGFPAGTVITLAHIHTGGSTVAGPVLVPMVPNAGEVTMPNGSGSYVHTGFPVTPVDTANSIIANPAGFYFNVHTALNPGGVARGQLALAQ